MGELFLRMADEFSNVRSALNSLSNARKPTDPLDRDAEWTRLVEAAGSDHPELCIVLGRRRAGKSYLLTRFASVFRGLYYQAAVRSVHYALFSARGLQGDAVHARLEEAKALHFLLDDLYEPGHEPRDRSLSG